MNLFKKKVVIFCLKMFVLRKYFFDEKKNKVHVHTLHNKLQKYAAIGVYGFHKES